MTYPEKYLSFDTWLLQAVMLANLDGSGTVKRILTAADLMSKTPMTELDLRGGLLRLVQNGFVGVEGGVYFPTAMVPAGIKWSEREKVRQLLEAEPTTEQNTAAAGDLSKLAGDYVKRFQGFMSGLNKPKKD